MLTFLAFLKVDPDASAGLEQVIVRAIIKGHQPNCLQVSFDLFCRRCMSQMGYTGTYMKLLRAEKGVRRCSAPSAPTELADA